MPHVIKDKLMGSKILLAKMFAKPTGGRAIAALATPAKSPAKRASATWQQRIGRLFVCAGVRRRGPTQEGRGGDQTLIKLFSLVCVWVFFFEGG